MKRPQNPQKILNICINFLAASTISQNLIQNSNALKFTHKSLILRKSITLSTFYLKYSQKSYMNPSLKLEKSFPVLWILFLLL